MSNKFQDWYEEFMDMYEYALEKDEIIYFSIHIKEVILSLEASLRYE